MFQQRGLPPQEPPLDQDQRMIQQRGHQKEPLLYQDQKMFQQVSKLVSTNGMVSNRLSNMLVLNMMVLNVVSNTWVSNRVVSNIVFWFFSMLPLVSCQKLLSQSQIFLSLTWIFFFISYIRLLLLFFNTFLSKLVSDFQLLLWRSSIFGCPSLSHSLWQKFANTLLQSKKSLTPYYNP